MVGRLVGKQQTKIFLRLGLNCIVFFLLLSFLCETFDFHT